MTNFSVRVDSPDQSGEARRKVLSLAASLVLMAATFTFGATPTMPKLLF